MSRKGGNKIMRKYLIAIVAFVLCLLAVGCNQEITSGEIIEFDKTQTKNTVLTVWMDDTDGIFMDEITSVPFI